MKSIFYKSIRIGKNLKPFQLLKFRTMVEGADKIGPPSTKADDPRITKIGAFMRSYKLDELPQLINVLRGEMNLVGPRPEVKEVVDLMTDDEKEIIFSVKPGITDLASLYDFNEEERLKGQDDPHQYYLDNIWPKKKELQIKYIRERSLWLDIKIIVKTIWRILKIG